MIDYVLVESLKQHRIITIIYQGENKDISQRDIKVLKMQEDKIEAYCYLRHRIRNFKKSNVLAALSIINTQNNYI